MHKYLLAVYLLFFFSNSNAQIDMLKSDKRKPLHISILDCPIKASLEIETDRQKVIAVLNFFNSGDSVAMIENYNLGGDDMQKDLFSLIPIPYIHNLQFIPRSVSCNPRLEYIQLQPEETLVVKTVLTDFYNFTEKDYDDLDIIYHSVVNCVDTSGNPVYGIDSDNRSKPVVYLLNSNKIRINRDEIKSILEEI